MFLLTKVFVFLVYIDRLEVVTMLVFVEDYHHIAFVIFVGNVFETFFQCAWIHILILLFDHPNIHDSLLSNDYDGTRTNNV